MAFVLLSAGMIAIVMGTARSEWKLSLAGAGVVLLGLIYLIAAIRRRPL